MKYDDYSWHLEGDFPADLPDKAAATHIGMFLAWAIHAGCVSDLHRNGHAHDHRAVLDRRMTGRSFLLKHCDGQLTDEDLSREGSEFAKHAYSKRYLKIVDHVCGRGRASAYHAPDTWAEFDRIRGHIDDEYTHWRDNYAVKKKSTAKKKSTIKKKVAGKKKPTTKKKSAGKKNPTRKKNPS